MGQRLRAIMHEAKHALLLCVGVQKGRLANLADNLSGRGGHISGPTHGPTRFVRTLDLTNASFPASMMCRPVDETANAALAQRGLLVPQARNRIFSLGVAASRPPAPASKDRHALSNLANCRGPRAGIGGPGLSATWQNLAPSRPSKGKL